MASDFDDTGLVAIDPSNEKAGLIFLKEPAVGDQMSGQMIEKMESRTKILSLSSGTLIVYQLPEEISVDTLKFASEGGRLLVTDGKSFTMNLAEFTHGGQV